ncbi:MAG: hypothetical protein IPL89_03895 [Acidobacteria bacterium]|nr:hypothetical protein [Acidobacteriota bacterium]
MILRAALAAALVLPAAGAPAVEPSSAAAEVAGLLPGSYVSRDPAASVRFSVAAVPKNRIAADAPVFYLEAAKSARPDAPFLQRFLKVEADGARVAVRVYEPRDLAGVRGKWREPEALSVFTERDVRERPDCRMTLVKAPAGHWAGGTAAATCFSAAANAPLAVTMSLSPQTLEWREEGKSAAGEISIFGREREGCSSSSKEAPAAASAVLTISSPSSPSKKYDLAELRAMAGSGALSLRRLVPAADAAAASVVVVTSRSAAISVFSFAEISSSSLSPSLDVSGAAPRLVAAPGRGLDDVVSVELRVLGR